MGDDVIMRGRVGVISWSWTRRPVGGPACKIPKGGVFTMSLLIEVNKSPSSGTSKYFSVLSLTYFIL